MKPRKCRKYQRTRLVETDSAPRRIVSPTFRTVEGFFTKNQFQDKALNLSYPGNHVLETVLQIGYFEGGRVNEIFHNGNKSVLSVW